MTQNPDGHASKGDEKHERRVQRRVRGFGLRTNCGWVHSPPGMAAAYEPTPKGALALHLTGPLGKGRCDTGTPRRRSTGRPQRGRAAAGAALPGSLVLPTPLTTHGLPRTCDTTYLPTCAIQCIYCIIRWIQSVSASTSDTIRYNTYCTSCISAQIQWIRSVSAPGPDKVDTYRACRFLRVLSKALD